MKVESLDITIAGHKLHRLVMHPEEGVKVRAVMICYHGQGDYAARYEDVLGVFTQRGIRCVMTELRGHGYSSGRRGDCGDENFLDAIIDDTISEYVLAQGQGDGGEQALSYGVMGHSMGGLLAMRHITLAAKGRFPTLSFGWLSSPLVDPTLGRTRRFVKMVQFLGHLVPSWTISTKVRPSDCRVVEGPLVEVKKEVAVTPSSEQKSQLWHSRVSVGWGAVLIRSRELIAQNVSLVAEDFPILVTQGLADTVCPAEQTRELVSQIPSMVKEYLELEGVLHDPFTGEGRDRLFTRIGEWIDEVMA